MLEMIGAADPEEGKRRGIRSAPLFSAVIHLALVAWIILAPRVPPQVAAVPVDPVTVSQPIALPVWRPVAPELPREPSAEPPRTQELGPDSDRPDEKAREAGAEHQVDPDQINPDRKMTDAPPDLKDQSAPPVDATPPPEPTVLGPPTQRSSLQPERTSPLAFVPLPKDAVLRGSATEPPGSTVLSSANPYARAGFSRSDGENWQPSFATAAGRCVEIPDLGVDAEGKPVLASVQGRVFWPDHARPLAGAHLQIVGTTFTTFTDSNGEYLLRFDPRLLEKCRIQYVQVRATGFQGELLTLSIGEKVRSDDVVLRRR